MNDRRQTIAAAVREYLLKNGLNGLSLRPLAEAVGVSARMLIYHFGSREQLLDAVMADVRSRMQSSFTHHLEIAADKENGLLAFWRWAIAPENLGYVRLLYEVQVLAIREPETYAHYLSETSASWLDLIRTSSGAPDPDRTFATLAVAVVDGLLLEFLSTGDAARTTAALQKFYGLANESRVTPGGDLP